MKKRIASIVIIIVLIVVIAMKPSKNTTTTTQTTDAALTAGVTSQLVNIDTEIDKTITVVEETKTDIVAESYDSETTEIEEAESQTEAEEDWKIGYIKESTNVRSEPNLNSEIFTVYTINTEIKYIEENDKWVRIEYEDGWAYIAKSQISDNKIDESNINCSPKYSKKDVEELAHIIYAEGGSNKNSKQMLYCIGSVIINRKNSKHFPNTIHGVIHEKGQYSPARGNRYMKKKPTKRCYDVAKDLLKNGSTIPSGVLGQAGYGTYKKYSRKLYYKEGRNYFFYIKGIK